MLGGVWCCLTVGGTGDFSLRRVVGGGVGDVSRDYEGYFWRGHVIKNIIFWGGWVSVAVWVDGWGV